MDVRLNAGQPLVSVVTPVYNGASFLEASIESVLSQTWSNWELVIVDNASTDTTSEVISRFASGDPRFRVFRNERTVNILENHNIAVGRISASSKYCKILQADDSLFPECLEKMVAVAEAHASIGIVSALAHAGSRLVGTGLPRDRSFYEGRDVARRTLLGETYPFWSPSCLMHRSAAVTERQPFWNEQDLHADVQSSYEILRRWDFGFVHEPLMTIGVHRDSTTSVVAKPMKKLLSANLDHLGRYGPEFLSADELAARTQQQLDDYYRNLAKSAFEWRGLEFWRFHRQALRKAGHPMSVTRLLGSLLSRFASSPLTCCRSLARAALKRKSA
ncbi:MAG TPA: glycosyltransferase family 2 protein [Gammaproteobacteria bacterium]|nr:glycosyltransferase family 2 protein [Gammaproteobacteria bacterium]